MLSLGHFPTLYNVQFYILHRVSLRNYIYLISILNVKCLKENVRMILVSSMNVSDKDIKDISFLLMSLQIDVSHFSNAENTCYFYRMLKCKLEKNRENVEVC